MSAIAIDFGTSNTLVCTSDPLTQTPLTLRFDSISRQFETVAGKSVTAVPTLVYVAADGLRVGEQVRSQRLGFGQPERYFHAFKRDLVADFQAPPRLLDGQTCTPQWIAEQFLQQIWQQVQQQLQPTQVILTVPVGAFERYLDWFQEVAEKLAFPNVRFVDEATAAALGYGMQHPDARVLVIDFGGGTLDLSLVRMVSANPAQTVKAEVLAKADAYVGGVDIDLWLVEHYLQQTGLSRQQVGEVGWQNLMEIAERLKIRLSRELEARESWFDDENFVAYELQVTRSQLDDILEYRQLLEQVRRALDKVLLIALNKGISKADITQVLLIGGSCYIPAVQQLVVSYFGRQRVKLTKPFEAVAHGALALSQIGEIDDYLHHSYAIRLWEPYAKTYSYYPLFERGSHYPCQRPEALTLQVATEGQREIRLDIGEVAEVSQAEVIFDREGRMTSSQLHQQSCFRSLNPNHPQVCVAHLDPPGQIGIDRITVQFEVDPQRILLATVRDLLTDRILVEREAIAKLR